MAKGFIGRIPLRARQDDNGTKYSFGSIELLKETSGFLMIHNVHCDKTTTCLKNVFDPYPRLTWTGGGRGGKGPTIALLPVLLL